MIQAEHFYYGVNVVLGLACLVSIFLAGKYVSDKGTRTLLITALVLLIVSGATISFCQQVLRKATWAFIGDLYGVTEGAFETIGMFASISVAANILEVAAIWLSVLAAKKLVSLRAGAQSEGGAEQ